MSETHADGTLDSHAADPHEHQHQAPYLLFILLVSVCAIAVLAAEMAVQDRSEAAQILGVADAVLCALFFVDFLICFKKAKQKWKYMVTWGWLDLISCLPAWEVLRWGRGARLLRVLRVLRGVRSARILMRFILERRAQSAALAAGLASIVVIAFASIAMLHFEESAGELAKIRTADDALWWATVTICTVGYGDLYPVTKEGRLVAAALMMVGVGLLGTWSGIAASWFLRPSEKRQEVDLLTLHEEIRGLRAELEARKQI